MAKVTFDTDTMTIKGIVEHSLAEGFPKCVEIKPLEFECELNTDNSMAIMKWIGEEAEEKQLEAMEKEEAA